MAHTPTQTAAFLAAHAAPLPGYITREAVQGTLARMNRDAARASAIAPNATCATLTLDDPEGRAICTLTRPRVLDRDGLYTVALCDGRTVAAFDRCPTAKRCLEACYAYLRPCLPADSGLDLAAELESYRASFEENWTCDSPYPIFMASSLTHAARWAYRIAAAEAAKDTARAEALDSARSCLAAYPPADLERQKGGAAWRDTAKDLRATLAGLVAALS